MGQRRRARECALQMLFQIDLTGVDPEDVFANFWEGKEAEASVRAFSEAIVRGVCGRREALDVSIAATATKWRIDRMAVVDRNVLRMALFELERDPDTPAAVVIDEAIEVARRFGSEESANFVNGVLDGLRRSQRTQESR